MLEGWREASGRSEEKVEGDETRVTVLERRECYESIAIHNNIYNH